MDPEEVISVSSFLHDLKQPLAHLGGPLAPWHPGDVRALLPTLSRSPEESLGLEGAHGRHSEAPVFDESPGKPVTYPGHLPKTSSCRRHPQSILSLNPRSELNATLGPHVG